MEKGNIKWIHPKYAKIYGIKNTVTGRIYIGRTNDVARRLNNHFSLLRKGKHNVALMQEDYNQYGRESFEARIIENSDVIDFLYDDGCGHSYRLTSNNNRWRECYWMQYFKTFDPNYGYNYNDTYARTSRKFESFQLFKDWHELNS